MENIDLIGPIAFNKNTLAENEKALHTALLQMRDRVTALLTPMLTRLRFAEERIAALGASITQQDTPEITAYAVTLRELRLRLFGDEEMRAKWEKQQKTGTYPNHPGGEKIYDPELGELDRLRVQIHSLDDRISSLTSAMADLAGAVSNNDDVFRRLEELLGTSKINFTFLKKLEAFFGPLLESREPPLDGEQIATKAYVDDAVQRFASRIRDQVSRSIEVVNAIWQHVGEAMGSNRGLNVGAIEIAKAIAVLVQRERARIDAEEAAKNRPSRIGSLLYALTGRNGVQ